ncbi:MAG: NAD(P)/FAD-dependent oxidoreductase [Acidobacteriaceae bacterium]
MQDGHIIDVVIAGGGTIGLTLALELRQQGLSVAILESGRAMQGASWAAGGMLAAMDPENPLALRPLSLKSIALYPEYLARVRQLSGQSVPLRTRRTLQQAHATEGASLGGQATAAEMRSFVPGMARDILEQEGSFFWLQEDSLDPRDLCRALPRAVLAAGATLMEKTTVLGVQPAGASVSVQSSQGQIEAGMFVNCCGAWAGALPMGTVPVTPVKGQMVTVALAAERLRCVVRMPGTYLIPRGDGRVTIGATVERAGFDTSVQESSIQWLVDAASTLLPELQQAQRLESWAGFRPGTPDALPILGPAEAPHCWLATGHYRNGILLAPATARCLAQAMMGELPDVALDAFAAARFTTANQAAEGGFA